MKAKRLIVPVMVFLLLSCVTINIYFPAEEVRKTAEEIVGEVRSYEAPSEKEKPNPKTSPQSLFEHRKGIYVGISVCFAQKELTVSNAAIRTLKEKMKRRAASLAPFYDKGAIGEGHDGYVKIRSLDGLDFKEKATLKRLVEQENGDRKNLYNEIARALNIDPSQVGRIGQIFAQEWQKTSRPGWWIERQPGKWQKK
ncbi:YdbL family protein [Thermodesulforhabdus norvegica]|uniref:Uncharacterized conserved protein YdbL, DUF1318 family n=1 Tax=Thermodesulforhabdus norvegica TaxID=39841 RepID=A0A1I4U6V7_9BACT|nr:YdbL family protein [Thermodesulforhabdus norvegica]SFM84687.1 Uncharacterized conserved protein YdbL, DUF1318 family [Thermodesulforhabdus norvegica]